MDVVAVSDGGALQRCIDALNNGSVVIVPTRRWYMFAARADRTGTGDAIFAMKRRPAAKSLLLAASSRDWVEEHFELGSDAYRLAELFWPGDLALRLRWRNPAGAVGWVGNPVGLVAVTDDLLSRLARLVKAPLVTTSVNFAGKPSEGGTQPSFAFEQVLSMFDRHPLASQVAVAVDGGICPIVDATTVVDASDPERLSLERYGVIHRDAIQHACPRIDTAAARRDMEGYVVDAYRR